MALGITSSLIAQPSHLSSSAFQLHTLFKKVGTVSSPSANLQYGRSAHVVDKRFFDYVYADLDTNYQAQWLRMYDEVRYMHWDTTNLEIADSVYRDVVRSYAGDTIPIGIMDYKFYRLKDDALTTNNYFIFHTSAGYLEDDPNRTDHGFNSDLSQLFVASPLKREAKNSTVTYAINPKFIFKDGQAGSYQSKAIRIDYYLRATSKNNYFQSKIIKL